MTRFVPPAGAPLRVTQIFRALGVVFSSDGSTEECLLSLAAHLKVRYVFGVSSGRAGLWLILKSLHCIRPDRCVVALPAYTCFSVPAAIVRTGLMLHPVDIDPETLDFNFSQLEAVPSKRLLCILTSNLFGLVNDVPRIKQIAYAKGAFLVDDAAQSLGASRDGYFSGTLGDVGLYSLGRGKVLAAIEGGIIVTNSEEIAHAIRAQTESLPTSSFVHGAWLLAQMLAYTAFLHPRLYWVPNSLRFLKLGITEFDPNFPAARLSALSQALLPQLMSRLTEMNQIRRKNAAALAQVLIGNPHFIVPRPASNCQPTYTRFPLIAKHIATRQQALSRLRTVGIGASSFYPSAICDITGIDQYMGVDKFHCVQAESLSRKLLTLPTHPLVRQLDLDRMAAILTGL